jgi:hypothetical protein
MECLDIKKGSRVFPYNALTHEYDCVCYSNQ